MNSSMQNKNNLDDICQKSKDAYLNDMQFLRLYKLYNNRKFLHDYTEKRIIQNLQPININPKHIINLGSDLTNNIKNCFNLSKYNLYKNTPKITHILESSLLHKEKKIAKKSFNINVLEKTKFFLGYDLGSEIYYTGSILEIPPHIKAGSIDIIYSNLALSYYANLPEIIKTWSKVLTNNGLIIFSLFGIGTANNLPFTLPLIDMHDIGDMLIHSKFSSPVIHAQRINLDYKNSNTKAILKDLHAFGLLFNKNADVEKLGNKKLYSLFSQINSIELEIVYAHAWKIDNNHESAIDKELIISLDNLHRKFK